LSKQVRFKQTSERVCTDGQVPDESSRLWGGQLNKSTVIQPCIGWLHRGSAFHRSTFAPPRLVRNVTQM